MTPAGPNPGSGQKEGTAAGRAAKDPVAKARHDLRNPLAHILGFSEMAMEKAQERGFNHLKSRVKVIHQTATQMLEQINEGLDAAKIEAGLTDLLALQQQICKHSDKIITIGEASARKARKLSDDALGGDLDRIIGAARQLIELAGSCFTPISGQMAGESMRRGMPNKTKEVND